ncbi:MAG: hypothetical protein J6B55_02470 [Clostridia bacterium]|nr:hypothetical protein [Clostridia bacterium]
MAAADNRPEIKIELPKRKEIKKSKKIALCAVFSALGVVLLYMGALIEVLDLSAAAIASMLCVVVISEIGGAYPWLLYAVTSILSLLLLPNKFGALIYTFMAGYYPMLKAKIEQLRSNGMRLVLKIGFFNLSMTVIIAAAKFIFALPGLTKVYIIALYAIGNVTFIVFDIALSMLIRAYFVKYRKMLRIEKILK